MSLNKTLYPLLSTGSRQDIIPTWLSFFFDWRKASQQQKKKVELPLLFFHQKKSCRHSKDDSNEMVH